MKQVRRGLSLLLTLCLLLSLCVVGASAEDATEVSDAAGLESAIAGEAGTIKLMQAVELTSPIDIDKTVTIDLNGNSITGKDSRVLLVKGGTLTLTGTGTISSTHTEGNTSFTKNNSVIRVSGDTSAAKLIVGEDVTISTAWCYGISIFGNLNAQTLDVYGTIGVTGEKPAIGGNGNASQNSTINIFSGAAVTAAYSAAIFHPQAGTLSITGGEISGTTAVEAESGTITVSGGAELTATGGSVSCSTANVDGAATAGYALAVVERKGYKGDVNAAITGGTFTGAVGKPVSSANTEKPNTLTITGGTFSDLNVIPYLADNANVTVKLADNITSPDKAVYYDITKSITLDLNGYELSGLADGAHDTSNTYFIGVKDGATLTVTDSSAEQTGKISATYKANSLLSTVLVFDSSKLILNKGLVTNGGANYGAADINLKANSSFEMNGGKIVGTTPAANKRAYAVNSAGAGTTIKILGGWIETETTTHYAVSLGKGTVDAPTTLDITGGTVAAGVISSSMSGYTSIAITDMVLGENASLRLAQNNPLMIIGGTFNGKVEAKSGKGQITGGLFKNTVSANRANNLTISGGYFAADPSDYLASGYKVFANGGTYAYRVAKIPANKIETTSAVVETAIGGDTTEDVSVSVNGSTIAVSGKISDTTNKAIITYTCTDGKTGKVTVIYDTDHFVADLTSVTVGGTTYTVNLTGLSILPAEVKVAAPVAEAKPADDASEATRAAATAISNNTTNISASGLGAAVTDETVNTKAKAGDTEIKVGTDNNGSTTMAATDVIAEAKNDSNAPEILKDGGAELVVVIQPVLNIEVKDLVTAEDNSKILKLDISAQSQAVVTTKEIATGSTAIITESSGSSPQNAVAVGEPVAVRIDTPVTLTIPVPAGFVAVGSEDNIFVEHEMHNGRFETVKATYNKDQKTITFTVNGMSPMNVITDARACTLNYSDGTSATLRVSELGEALHTPAAPAGKVFSGWKLTDANGNAITDYTGTYRQFTDDMLTALNGKTITATAVFTNAPVYATGVAPVKNEFPFTDVAEDYWARDEIAWAYENGYMKGKTATLFVPTAPVTRQQLWMVLARMSGANPDSMAEARVWAVENKVSDGSNPGQPVTRQQLATTLYRYAALKNYTLAAGKALTDYDDAASVAAYAEEAMQWAVAAGLIQGNGAKLNPVNSTTRAQFAAILYRFCDKVAK